MQTSIYIKRLSDVMPGILVATTISMAAFFLSDHYGGPTMLFALLLGIAFNFLSEEESRCMMGVQFSATRVLRIGVALLGFRITFDQILSLGYGPIMIIVGLITLTILFGFVASKLFKIDLNFGILTGCAVAICGASAALAISSILPKNKNLERNTIFTVVGVTTLSTIAMIVYPVITDLLHLNEQRAGFFLGATIHDVAQVVGAGYSISDNAGDVATYTKMVRVALLLPVVVVLSILFQKQNTDKTKVTRFPLPVFLVFFVVFVVINSMGYIPVDTRFVIIEISRWCLVVAVASLGMKTSIKKLVELGPVPVTLIACETLFLALLAVGAIKVFY